MSVSRPARAIRPASNRSCTARCAALLLSSCLAGPALAQAGSQDIIVTATRTPTPASALPAMVTIVDAESIDEQLAISSDLQGLLGTMAPGFAPSRQKLSGFGESFRGRSPLYLIDGVPQSNPLRDGSRDGYTIDLAVIERIEIINGANAIQGLGATGGIVNYVTRKPDTSGNWAAGLSSALTATDDFDSDGFEFRAGGYVSRDFGAIDFIAAASYHKRGLFYDGAGRTIGVDGTQGDLADSEQRNFFVKIGLEPGQDQRLQLTVNDFRLAGDGDYGNTPGDIAAGIPAQASDTPAQGEPATNDVTTVSLDYSHGDLLGGRLQAQLYYQDFEAIFGGGTFGVFQDPAIAPVGTLFDQSANNSEKLGARLSYDRQQIAGIIDLIAGVDALRDKTFQALILTGRNWVPETQYRNIAPFAQASVAVSEVITLAGGLRYEIAELRVDDFNAIAGNRSRSDFLETPVIGGSPTFDDLLLNGALIVEPVEGVSAYFSYAEGYTIADVGRVLRGISAPGTRIDDLLRLNPVLTENIEFGASLRRDWLSAQIAYYISSSNEGALLVADADGIFSVEREKTRVRGFEAKLEVAPTPAWQLGANLSVLTGRVDTDDDGSLDADLDGINIGPNRLNLYARYAHGPWSARLQAATLFDRSFEDAAGTTSARFDGYTTLDAVVGVDMGLGKLSLGVQNLLDKQYITYFSQAANTRDDRYFAGRGRTVTLSYGLNY